MNANQQPSVVGRLLLSDPVHRLLRRELRRLFLGVRATTEELGELLRTEVLKRDVFEGDKAQAAEKAVRKGARRRLREKAASDGGDGAAAPVDSAIIGANPSSVPEPDSLTAREIRFEGIAEPRG